MGAIHRAPTVHNKDKVGAPQYRLDKENHREKYSKKQSNSRKKQSCGSSNPANMDVFFEPFLLQFLLSKRYWGTSGIDRIGHTFPLLPPQAEKRTFEKPCFN